MKLLFSYSYSLASPEKVQEFFERLRPEIMRMAGVRATGYDEPAGFVNIPFDQEYYQKSYALAQEKKQLQPRLLLLIGIGGSSLGTVAVQEALHGLYYNNQNPEILFYSADTVDPDKILELKKIIVAVLVQGERVLITVVTKSGTTTETMCNAAIFIDLLKQYYPDDYAQYVVTITDKNSPLWDYSKAMGFACLEIPQQVGGRYSVFSAVGIFPLEVLGIATQALLDGAQSAVKVCTHADKDNYAVASAALLFFQYQQGMQVHDTFLFDASLESVGKWYRQLMAESLGKDGKGMLPTVSMGTVDLHSMVQLYLGGPALSFTTFITTESSEKTIIPKELADSVGGTSVTSVLQAIALGVQETYAQENKPFVLFSGLQKNAYSLGFFLQLKMLEIVYLGYLMGVNPFDQPQVELYKANVRELLIE
jgi:glucose-6-phosphate isomerase